jgi:hypothetical protein
VLDIDAAVQTQPVAVRKPGPDLIFGRFVVKSAIPEMAR